MEMEGEEPLAAVAEEAKDKVRIYVGGIGESVTSEDIAKIFGWLGSVRAVDIVRTKGRSFAYVDFFPSSTNSLSKLFTTYNGCLWKGGKLRLERAKEDYLTRLRREWKEDSEALVEKNAAAASSNVVHSEKPKKDLLSENKKLKIFFPALRKVKSIPYSGTGKHKYSFRRVDAPPVPKYFCDCQEHSAPPDVKKDEQTPTLEKLGVGVNEEEVEMMNFVMNKIFQEENVSSAPHAEIELDDERDNHVESIDNVELNGIGEEDYNDDDDDNLVINIVSQPQFQELRHDRSKRSMGASTHAKLKEQQSRPGSHNEERKSTMNKENDAKTSVSVSSSIPEISANLEAPLHGPGQSGEPKPIAKQLTPGVLWSQKSSWRDAVGQKGTSAFSISDILPGISSTKEEDPESGKVLSNGSGKRKKLKHERQVTQSSKGTEVERNEGLQPMEVKSTIISLSQSEMEHESHVDQLREVKGVKILAESQPIEQDSDSNKSEKELTDERQMDQSSKAEGQRTAESQPTAQNLLSNNSGRGSAWRHESSWTQLVSGNNSSSFSISQILPGTFTKSQEPEKHDNMKFTMSNNSEHDNVVEEGKSASPVDEIKNLDVTDSDDRSTPRASQQNVVGYVKATRQITNDVSITKRTPTKSVAIGETCSFMRNAASLKEWANTKAALKGAIKRKANER